VLSRVTARFHSPLLCPLFTSSNPFTSWLRFPHQFQVYRCVWESQEAVCAVCFFQVRRICAVKSTASHTMRASRFSPPVTPTATAEVEGSAVCRLVLWMPVFPLQTVPTHNISGYRENAARNGCVKTSRTQSFRMPSQVNSTEMDQFRWLNQPLKGETHAAYFSCFKVNFLLARCSSQIQ